MKEQICVAVIDDHPVVREGVRQALQSDPVITVVAEGASKDEAVAIARDRNPDLMLIDIDMPGGGVEAVASIAALPGETRMVMLTVSEDEEILCAALAAGAIGYVLKGISADDLRRCVQLVNEGKSYISPTLAAGLVNGSSRKPVANLNGTCDALNYRETQVLELLSTGLTNKEIAERLELKEKTVKHYLSGVLQKLNLRNRVEAALFKHNVKV